MVHVRLDYEPSVFGVFNFWPDLFLLPNPSSLLTWKLLIAKAKQSPHISANFIWKKYSYANVANIPLVQHYWIIIEYCFKISERSVEGRIELCLKFHTLVKLILIWSNFLRSDICSLELSVVIAKVCWEQPQQYFSKILFPQTYIISYTLSNTKFCWSW